MHRIVKVLFILCFFPSIVRSRKTVNLFTDIFLKIRTLQNNLGLHLDPRSLKTPREGLFIKRKKKMILLLTQLAQSRQNDSPYVVNTELKRTL